MDTVEKYRRYVTTSALAAVEPITVESARGATVTATDGTEYTDLYSGIGVVNAGHVPPKVAEAAKRQMDKVVHSCSYVYHVPVVADLAERLAQVTPGRLQKTFFGNSGAEAVEGALRLARAFSGRREIIALQGSFHGRTAGALAVTGNALRKHRGGAQIAGIAFAPTPNPYRCRMCSGSCSLACADAVDDVIRYDTSDDVAAFIIEPIIGEGGIIPLPDGYLRRVKEILDARGILLIVDEVQSGFGRSGRMFAVEAYDVEPDIMTMAKGIASGFPLGRVHRARGDRRRVRTRRSHEHIRGQPRLLRGGRGHHRHARRGAPARARGAGRQGRAGTTRCVRHGVGAGRRRPRHRSDDRRRAGSRPGRPRSPPPPRRRPSSGIAASGACSSGWAGPSATWCASSHRW